MSKLLRGVGAIFGAVLIGAIGSGIWERVLSPALYALLDFTSTILSTLSSGYRDSLYERAARYSYDSSSLGMPFLVLYLIGMLLAGLPFVLHLRKRASINEISESIYRFFVFGCVVSGFFFVALSFFGLTRADAVSKIREESLKSIEVLRPYVGEKKYFMLRSEYYLIDSKEDFDKFVFEVLSSANATDIKLPLRNLKE